MNNQQLPFEYISVQDATHIIDENGHMIAMMDVCGFFLCQRGSVDVSLDDKTYHIQRGDVYFYMPTMLVGLLSHSRDLEGIAVKCDLDFVLPMVEQSYNVSSLLTIRENPCVSLSADQQHKLEGLANLVREHHRQLTSASYQAGASEALQHLVLSLAQSLFYELIYDYASNKSLRPEIRDTKDRIFQAFLVSLFKHYRRQREVNFYAEEQCLTPRYFSSVIKEKSGHSALQWIVQIVISSARKDLLSTDLSIKEIASAYNFPTQSFFGKYFKQYVGVSPKEYRNRERGTMSAL